MLLKIKLLPVVVAFAIILGAGYVHGVWSFRWSATRSLQTAKEKLETIPIDIGDWKGKKEAPLDKRQTTIGQIHASVSRQYVNSKTGAVVSILLVCGRPGPLSVHTPEVCYAGSGYEIDSNRSKVSIEYDKSQAQFWSLKLHKNDPTRTDRMIIDYGWFAEGKWSAPETDARFQFAGVPVLYKMYVIREQTRASERTAPDADPTMDFLKTFLPILQKTLGDST